MMESKKEYLACDN